MKRLLLICLLVGCEGGADKLGRYRRFVNQQMPQTAVMKKFQEMHGVEPSGRVDDATRKKLSDVHGC